MHDPDTLAFDIKIPIPFTKKEKWGRRYIEIARIWHRDPEKDGTDDSCGWFKRSRHGREGLVEKVMKDLDYDWDRVFVPDAKDHDDEDGPFVPRSYSLGLFLPNGSPNMSPVGITLNLFFMVAYEHFGREKNYNRARRKAHRYMRKHLWNILQFAENPHDSIWTSITCAFGGIAKPDFTERERKEWREDRMRNMVSTVYGCILRDTQKWHPRWHIHHWRIQVPFFQKIRNLFRRCPKCGKSLGWGKSCTADWNGNILACYRCDRLCCAAVQETTPG